MTPEEFRKAGHELVDWIADYRSSIGDLPVQSQVKPGSVAAQLPASAPEEPEAFAALLRDLDEVIVPGLSHVHHPRYFGWFPANSDLGACSATRHRGAGGPRTRVAVRPRTDGGGRGGRASGCGSSPACPRAGRA